MNIFDDIHRSDGSEAKETESHAAFLNRAHTPYWESVRDFTESWFSRLCPDAQDDLRGRLRSEDNAQFLSAFWELYLHESLLKAGYAVECHPRLPGTSRRPDFLAISPEQSFYLEACRLDTPAEKKAEENRRNQVYDAIQKIDSPNFFLHLDVHSIGPTSPSVRRLCTGLERWLDPDAIARQIEVEHSLADVQGYEWDQDGWKITFKPWPKAREHRGEPGVRPIGARGGDFAFMDDVRPFRKALAKKGSAYGRMDIPFVVAMYTSFVGPDTEDVSDSLYGTPQVEIRTAPDGRIETRPTQAFDGYYHNGTSWLHRNVSGVLVGVDVVPGRGTIRNVPTLWEHPGASHPVECLPMWGRMVIDDDKLVFEGPQVAMHEALGVAEDWPPGKPFEPYS